MGKAKMQNTTSITRKDRAPDQVPDTTQDRLENYDPRYREGLRDSLSFSEIDLVPSGGRHNQTPLPKTHVDLGGRGDVPVRTAQDLLTHKGGQADRAQGYRVVERPDLSEGDPFEGSPDRPVQPWKPQGRK